VSDTETRARLLHTIGGENERGHVPDQHHYCDFDPAIFPAGGRVGCFVIMGWGVAKAQRTALLQKHHLQTPEKYDALVIDMCSESRRVGSGPRAESANRLALRICKPLFAATPVSSDAKGGAIVVAMFDCKERMHEARGDLHKRRYKPASASALKTAEQSGALVIGGVAYSRGTEPYTREEVDSFTARSPVVWTRLWASAHGKDKSWELLYEGMIDAHHRLGEEKRQFVMWLRGTPFTWPYLVAGEKDCGLAAKLCDNNHGEGDQRVCEAARVLAVFGFRRILIQTIDTDMILQVFCTPDWGGKTGDVRGSLHLKLKNEVVNVGDALTDIGATADARLTAAFWCLACGGVDYCKGLTRFGFTTKELMRMVTLREGDVVHFSATCFTIELDVGALMEKLCVMPRRRVKNREVGDFVSELNAMMFCVALFAGASSKREPCGGPVMPCVDVFPTVCGATPFDAAFLGDVMCGKVECLSVTHVDR
jgi:hypothetical protein